MEIYKVGGFVRDLVLGRQPEDIDYVVVDSSVEEMLGLGYEQVGVDFPVFLHPDTKDEYALARLETSTGEGYGDFIFQTDSVTLRGDLARRDLTINSMALDLEGKIIDPFGGMADCFNKVLRHTSDAFKEDPVRILRIGRLLARFGPEWSVHDSTLSITRSLSSGGLQLQPERIWKEFSRALEEGYWTIFIEWVREVGNVLPELETISDEDMGILGKFYWKASSSPVLRFASLCSFLRVGQVDSLFERIKPPVRFARAGRAAALCSSTLSQNPYDVIPQHALIVYNKLHQAIPQVGGVTGFIRSTPRYSANWCELFHRVMRVPRREIAASMEQGPEIGVAIREAEVKAIERWQKC